MLEVNRAVSHSKRMGEFIGDERATLDARRDEIGKFMEWVGL